MAIDPVTPVNASAFCVSIVQNAAQTDGRPRPAISTELTQEQLSEVEKLQTDLTMRKMRQIHSAAFAPADPSPQDRAVAAQATAAEAQACGEELKQTLGSRAGATPPAAPAYSAPVFARVSVNVDTNA